MSEPYSDRVGCWFLSGYFLCPALMVAAALIIGEPTAEEGIDWDGIALPGRILFFLLLIHVIYMVGLVALLRGWRWVALGCGILSLPGVFLVYVFTYWHVSGVYI